jgi:hypothetical protein
MEFERKTAEYIATINFQIETANREHKSHKATLTDRLINTMGSRKMRLTKEKENVDLTEGAAGHLHPIQFSLTNPASPSGNHSKRATRHRRDQDDAGADNKKRKRNGDDDGSPAPQRRALDLSSSAPIWHNDRLATRKTMGVVYSIDKLFTDKELTMAHNTAALAAHKYLLTHTNRYDTNGQLLSSAEDSDSGGEHEEGEGVDQALVAPMMERNVSHATRSARGGANNNPSFIDDKLMGLEVLANFSTQANYGRMMASDPKLPPTFQSTYIKGHTKQSDFNCPVALNTDNAREDLAIIGALTQYDQKHGKGANFDSDNGSRKMLETLAKPKRGGQYVAYLQGPRPTAPEVRQRLGLPPARQERRAEAEVAAPETGATPTKTGRSGTPAHQSPAKGAGPTSAPALGGVSMSRQSSASGAPMSRSSSRKGRNVRGG